MFILWVFIFFFFLITEIGIPNLFFCLSISCGALGALFAHIYGLSFEVQIGIFCASTVVSFYLLRLFSVAIQSRLVHKTGAERLKGCETFMITSCDHQSPGTVHIAGTTWPAQSVDKQQILAGTTVRIVDIRNITLIVQPIKKHGGNDV